VAEEEGVIKYQLEFIKGPAPDPALISAINVWRHILFMLHLIGQDDSRYEGYGYGNVSCRVKEGSNEFVISGTQTAHLPVLTADHYVLVTESDAARNRIVASGLVKPSSEALTHGTLYQTNPAVNVVFHVHCPQIWKHADALGVASTARDVAYGTPQMAEEIKKLLLQEPVRPNGIFVMGGHQDGVIAFASSAEGAGNILVDYFARALQFNE